MYNKKNGNVILDNQFFFYMEISLPNSERNMAWTVKGYTISVYKIKLFKYTDLIVSIICNKQKEKHENLILLYDTNTQIMPSHTSVEQKLLHN